MQHLVQISSFSISTAFANENTINHNENNVSVSNEINKRYVVSKEVEYIRRYPSFDDIPETYYYSKYDSELEVTLKVDLKLYKVVKASSWYDAYFRGIVIGYVDEI